MLTCNLSICNFGYAFVLSIMKTGVFILVFIFVLATRPILMAVSTFCDPKLLLQETDKGFKTKKARYFFPGGFLVFLFLLSLVEEQKGAWNLSWKEKKS